MAVCLTFGADNLDYFTLIGPIFWFILARWFRVNWGFTLSSDPVVLGSGIFKVPNPKLLVEFLDYYWSGDGYCFNYE